MGTGRKEPSSVPSFLDLRETIDMESFSEKLLNRLRTWNTKTRAGSQLECDLITHWNAHTCGAKWLNSTLVNSAVPPATPSKPWELGSDSANPLCLSTCSPSMVLQSRWPSAQRDFARNPGWQRFGPPIETLNPPSTQKDHMSILPGGVVQASDLREESPAEAQ